MICGKTKPSGGVVRFKNYNLTGMIEYQITRVGVGRKFQTPSVYEDLTVFENLEISYPKRRGILGSLFFKRDQNWWVRSTKSPSRSFWTRCCVTRLDGSVMVRSNGWRSACC